MARFLPVLLALFGLLAGVGGGLMLRPAAEPADAEDTLAAPPTPRRTEDPSVEFVRLNNQFIVPVVTEARVSAIVVLSLSIEVPTGGGERVFAAEPRLRDAFLQVLFDHANAGGFGGAFTAASSMNALRTALREAAVGVLGPVARDVLIVEILRQDS